MTEERRTPSFSIDSARFDAPTLEPGLYIVATPIGHLDDITLRALKTLAAADLVCCEDTRVTRVLLERYGIRAHTTSYHEHNAVRQRPKLMERLAAGQAIALVSDAGTPLVSDPGFRLVEDVAAAGHRVFPIPGASALTASLMAAGLPTDTVVFLGFLPSKSGPRRRRLETFSRQPASLVFYESPNRLAQALEDASEICGPDRPAAVCRELTKRFETVTRGPLAELCAAYPAGATVKGEIAVVIAPPPEETTSAEDAEALLAAALGRLPAGKAAAEVARITGRERQELFKMALSLKAAPAEDDAS
ncbi:16S rRNA (cytidine(1402)-2'-O)-methyltransferase [Amorphus coralli]|uniref:16S rRNA (cytidine(1402)-2'-O)-methyltransferase n=1 Tax=Amorphus coralli TaxID=340680 RepID=UPI0003747EB8|nr:16S rRNA (cytidine(1402)-2'-O)-methyltransferase [Amorphus coralli]